MKKNFKFYALGWVLILALFNLIAFVSPGWATIEKLSPSFWIGYSSITVALIGQLICAWMAFGGKNAKETFYNVSILSVSYGGLVVTFIVGAISMIISTLPHWIAIIACAIVLVVNIIAVGKAKTAVELVKKVDVKVAQATSFIYTMRADSEALLARAKSDEAKAACKNVRDAFKYCDPMSNTALDTIESGIDNHFALFAKAVADNQVEVIASEADELLALIAARNSTCKSLK